MSEKDFYILIGFLFAMFGLTSTISLWEKAKKEFKNTELRVILFNLLLSTTISFACAGFDIIITNS